ncbi:hypothetical protein E4N62_38640 [Streptomyces sp. MNU76]|uniref:hypothetical protein n=1 Tax=Streptomyces sp. MNU76 TaxID=2560026 RepID=UPI001E43A8CC|nr:hypothetical protein [Streptomyces sp. MNU76]MCC9710644.1 hypothetical protein [Streptomyces sp. MNU76]
MQVNHTRGPQVSDAQTGAAQAFERRRAQRYAGLGVEVVDDGMAAACTPPAGRGRAHTADRPGAGFTSGKNKGQGPLAATVFRILAEEDAADGTVGAQT